MNALIVYDSQFGNTQKIADVIAAAIGAKAVKAQEFSERMLAGVDTVIVGSPIQGWRPTVATMAMLAGLSPGVLRGKHVAAFDTRFNTFFSGNAARKINSQLVKHGGEPLAAPEPFIVMGKAGPLADGEVEHARTWGRALATKVKN